MSDHYVIHGEHTGDWAVVRDGTWFRLFKPGHWSHSESQGLGWYPSCGITLPSNPARAHANKTHPYGATAPTNQHTQEDK